MLSQSNVDKPVESVDILLTINRAYKEAIEEKLESLRLQLKENLLQQRQIVNEINASQKQPIKQTHHHHHQSHQAIELTKIKVNYFKDRFGTEPKENIDTHRKSKFIHFDYMPQLKSEWTLPYRRLLKEAVIEDSRRLLKLPYVNKRKFLQEKSHEYETTLEFSELDEKIYEKKLLETQKSIKIIDKKSDLSVLEEVDLTKIDWLKIANINLKGNWTASECQLIWFNVCNLKINQSKWTNAEFQRLFELARKYNEKNWEKISTELGTNRTAFLCMKRYHEKTAESYCKREWTEAETSELCRLAEELRIGLFIPYNYLCYLNGTRDRNSIYNWHLKVDPNLNHGKWSLFEEQAFEEALLFYNTTYNWQEIAEYVGTRTALQCKDRYELKYYNPQKYINWSPEEDKLLLESVKKYNGHWSKIANYVFPSRNDHSCLFRYTRLMAWRKQNSWFDKQSDEIKEFILFISKKRKDSKEDNRMSLVTEDGEQVPTSPPFSVHSVSKQIEKFHEKKDLIKEFIQKKRQGQLSLTLLNKIGIITTHLNCLIGKYKKHYLLPNTETVKKIKARLNNRLKRGTTKEEPHEPTTSTVNEINKKIRKMKLNKALKEVSKSRDDAEIDDDIDELKEKIRLGEKPANIKSLLKLADNGVNLESETDFLQRKSNRKRKLSATELINNKENTKKRKQLKISDMIKLEDQCSRPSTIKDILGYECSPTSSIPMPPIIKAKTNKKVEKVSKKKGRPRKIIDYSMSSQTPKEPKTLSPLNNSVNELKVTKIKQVTISDLKVNEIKALKEKNNAASSSSSESCGFNAPIVDFNSIPDGEKIPCLTEQINSSFKFIYSLKKEKTNSSYFSKFAIINFYGKYIGIKPISSKVNSDYLTPDRLKKIEISLQNLLTNLKK